MYKVAVFLVIFKISATVFSQVENPPIPIEALVGSRGVALQTIINKKFRSIPQLGIFSATNFVAEYRGISLNELMTQVHLFYEPVKGFSILAGVHITPITGVRPSAGLMYSYANKKWLVVVNPRADLLKNGVVEMFAMAEFKPPVSEKLQLYTRLQGLYTTSTSKLNHERSYGYIRAGITFKEFTFGGAANLDFYGPAAYFQGNYGGFIMVQLF